MKTIQRTRRTRILLVALLAAFLILLLLYHLVLRPYLEAEEPQTPGVTPSDGEDVGFQSTTLLVYPRIQRAEMKSIEVRNAYDDKTGTYTVYRFVRDTEDADADGDTNDFIIEGFPKNTFDATKFSQLVVDTGYVSCLAKLSDLSFVGLDAAGLNDLYARYGLAEADHPNSFAVTKLEGETYTVHIGNKTPDGNYYARLEGRDAVYVLYADLEQSVLQPVTYFVDAALTPEADSSYAYAYIRNLTIYHGSSVVDLIRYGKEIEEDPYLMFTYLLTTQRDVFHAASVYGMLVPSAAYAPNDTMIDSVLQKLPAMEGTEVLKLGFGDDDFKEGGLLSDVAYTLLYDMPYNITYDANNDPVYEKCNFIRCVLFVSPRQADGTFLVGSMYYALGVEDAPLFCNMIARVPYSTLSFLTYDRAAWAQEQIVTTSIDDVSRITLQFGGTRYSFSIMGDGSTAQTVIEESTGYTWAYKGRRLPFSLNEQGYCDDISQFREWYMCLILADYEGDIATDSGMTQEEIDRWMQDDTHCSLVITLTMEDGRVFTYRFFPYSERHCMVSVSGGGHEEIVTFYTLNSVVRRIATSATDLLTGVEVDSDQRY